MARCSFCGHQVPKGAGTMFVHTAGKISWFCSRKCEKSLLTLKRKPRKFKWASQS